MSNGTIKIGYTGNLTERVKAIKAQFKLDVLNFYTTPFMTIDKAQKLEEELKARYAACSMGNEFFDVKFTDACRLISSTATRLIA